MLPSLQAGLEKRVIRLRLQIFSLLLWDDTFDNAHLNCNEGLGRGVIHRD